jgi:hypothetical protein
MKPNRSGQLRARMQNAIFRTFRDFGAVYADEITQELNLLGRPVVSLSRNNKASSYINARSPVEYDETLESLLVWYAQNKTHTGERTGYISKPFLTTNRMSSRDLMAESAFLMWACLLGNASSVRPYTVLLPDGNGRFHHHIFTHPDLQSRFQFERGYMVSLSAGGLSNFQKESETLFV